MKRRGRIGSARAQFGESIDPEVDVERELTVKKARQNVFAFVRRRTTVDDYIAKAEVIKQRTISFHYWGLVFAVFGESKGDE